MVTLPAHHNDRNTYILGDYILNGCLLFHISKLDEVCDEYNISDDIKQSLIKTWEENHDCNDEQRLDEYITSENVIVRVLVARYGRPQDLDVLVRDKDARVRYMVAQHRRDKDLNILVNDSYWRILCDIISYGRERDLDILINSEFDFIRFKANKKRLANLPNDSSVDVC